MSVGVPARHSKPQSGALLCVECRGLIEMPPRIRFFPATSGAVLQGKGRRQVSLTKVYLRALHYLAEERLRVSIVVVSNIVLALVAITEPILFGRIIDAMSSGTNSLPVLIAWAGLGIFNTVAFVLVAREADRLAHARRSGLLAEAFSRIISMPLAWHSQRGTSNVLHTLLRATETLFGLWLEFMRTHLSTAVALVLLVPAALSMDVRLSIVLLLLGVLYWLTGQVVMNRTREGQAAVEEHYHQVFSHVSDTISNVPVLHSYNRIERETQALKEYTGRLLSAQFPVLDWWALASALNRIASTISMMAILILGAIMVKSGEIKVGEVIAFIGFANLLISRLDQIKGFASQIFEARAKLEEFYKLEDSVREREESNEAEDLGRVAGKVEFRNVSFDFANTTQGVRDVSFTVEAGQTVAIVGPTVRGRRRSSISCSVSMIRNRVKS